jgi:hypothetical protein
VYPTDSSDELAYASFEQLIVDQLFNTSSKSVKTNVCYHTLAREESSDDKWIRTQMIDFKDGERGRNRTFNLLIKSQLLCQLSYAPTGNPAGGQLVIVAFLADANSEQTFRVMKIVQEKCACGRMGRENKPTGPFPRIVAM